MYNDEHDKTVSADMEAIEQSGDYPYTQDGRTEQEIARHKENFPWLFNEAGAYDPRFQDRPELEEREQMGMHIDKHIVGCPHCTQDVELEPLTYEQLQQGYSSPANPPTSSQTKADNAGLDVDVAAERGRMVPTGDMDPPTYIQEIREINKDIPTDMLETGIVVELGFDPPPYDPPVPSRHMSQAEALNHQQQMFDEALIIMQKKRFDYSGTVDPFKNLRDAAFVGVNPLQGVMVRIMDKFARIRSFIEEGTLKVNDESVRDTMLDALNYTCILTAMIEEENL